jgi:acetoin utilization protein AcuB
MTVKEIMTPRVQKVGQDESLRSVRNIFEGQPFHHLLVVHQGRLVGVLSDRDLLKHISPFVGQNMMERPQDRRTLNLRVHQIMSRKLHTVGPEVSVQVAADRMIAADVSCLPVVSEDGKPLGIVTWKDLLAACVALAPLPAGS